MIGQSEKCFHKIKTKRLFLISIEFSHKMVEKIDCFLRANTKSLTAILYYIVAPALICVYSNTMEAGTGGRNV